MLVVLDRAQLDAGDPALTAHAAHVGDGTSVFASPRWSPDGRRIAVERRVRGGFSEIVVVDAETAPPRGRGHLAVGAERHTGVDARWTRAAVRVGSHGRSVRPVPAHASTPTVVSVAAGSLERLTHRPGGATAPDVSPDGGTVVFVGYTVDGLRPVQHGAARGEACGGGTAGNTTAAGHAALPTGDCPARDRRCAIDLVPSLEHHPATRLGARD